MKTKVFLITVLLVCFGYCQTHPAMNFTIKALDGAGQPLPGALASASVHSYHVPGEGFGRDVNNIERRTTDDKGLANLSLRTWCNKLAYGVQKDGFYRFNRRDVKFTGNHLGTWQPDNQVFEVQMKPILKPIPLYAKNAKIALPGPPVDRQYDLEVGDWVAPLGKGKVADLSFTVEHIKTADERVWQAKLTVKTPGAHNGLIRYLSTPSEMGSELRVPHLAPEQGYLAEIHRHKSSAIEPDPPDKNFPLYISQDDWVPEDNYFLRVRTIVNDKGEIISHQYAKIVGGFERWKGGAEKIEVAFKYHYNPKPNDRNLEFDPKRNLFDHSKDPLSNVRIP